MAKTNFGKTSTAKIEKNATNSIKVENLAPTLENSIDPDISVSIARFLFIPRPFMLLLIVLRV